MRADNKSKKQTYSDEYIEHCANLYMTFNNKFNLTTRGIRFEAFLAHPDMYVEIFMQTQNVQELVDKNELEIEKLPGGGFRYGAFFQPMRQKKKQHHQRKSHINEQRVHA